MSDTLFDVPAGEGRLSSIQGVDVAELEAKARAAIKHALSFRFAIPREDAEMRRERATANESAAEHIRLLRAVNRGEIADELEGLLKK